jgi:hypothetical protein
MSTEQPRLRIQREITPDSCRVVYTMSKALLEGMLKEINIERADQLPDHYVRELVHRASAAGMARQLDEVAQTNPDGIAMVVGKDADGKDMEMRSSDVGYDMLKRFAPAVDQEMEMRCDPTYGPVDFELRVFDDEPAASQNTAEDIGSTVLSTTLHPPNLA